MLFSKLEVAERQLKQAVRLHFSRGDAISIHTLAGAASQIFYDIAKKRGVESFIRGNPFVRDDMRRAWCSALNEPQNFFKHADKDPDSTYEFDPEITLVFILEAASLSEQLIGELSWEARVFSIWFALKHQDRLVPGAYRDTIERYAVPGLDLEDFELISMVLDLGQQT